MLRDVLGSIRLVCCLLSAMLTTATALAAEPPVDYARQIRPLLSDRCYKCHGPDAAERKTELRLDVQGGATQKQASGDVPVVPGKSGESVLYRRLVSSDPDVKMPPPDSGKVLSLAEIELIKTWIDQGAAWRDHWSFVKPQRPQPPAVEQPVAAPSAIDAFVLHRLQKAKLAPAAPADKVTLVRRVTLDLTGLPPTPAEVDAFVADSSATAYETVVDRLLASPRFGEHFGRYWLDAVRYGDTHGLHFDNERSMWPYRDWVIEAFNRNLPFDRFTIEQVAGDLLPEATLEQKIASGFNRCNVTTSEGGSINDEVLVRYGVDRTEAVGTVWLGLTLGCAVCHSHKYDPISQTEFYQLFAFFNGAADAAMDGNAIGPAPIMKLPTAAQAAERKTLDERLAALRQQVATELAKIDYQEPEAVAGTASGEPREFVWIDDATPPNAKLQGNTPWEFVAKESGPVFSGDKASKRTAAGLSQHFFTDASPGLKVGEGDKLFAYVYLDPANPPKEIMLQWHDGAWEHRAFWGEDVIAWGAAGSASRLPLGPLPKPGEWTRLEVDADKVGIKSGATINGWAFTQHDGTCYWDKAGIVTRTPQEGQGFESQLAWEAYEKAQKKSTLAAPLQAALKVAPDKRNDEQKKQLREHFLENVCIKTKAAFDPWRGQITDLTKKRSDLEAAIPTTMVMADMPQPRETFVLVRGAYDKHGDKVTPAVPAVFPPLPEGAPANRLGLARWLVDADNPLTARVIVNRFWQQYFGVGLVKTAEDFGAQGQPPSHPDLLDWLATEFVASGWNVKALQKQIVMSATYRQSSHMTPALLARDPANELLARGPRFRLDGEVIRDAALAAGGLLVEKQGGRGVRPYQPEGIWEAVAFRGSNTQNYKADAGDGLYRRSLYTFWKRTAPPPQLTTFDAPSRETCTVRRARTNTPLQALVLMNDEQFVEASRKLAERMLVEGGKSVEDQAAFAFRVIAARAPSADELAVLVRVFESQLKLFQATPDSAGKLLAVGQSKRNESLDANQLAAATMVANLIMNLDEAVTKE